MKYGLKIIVTRDDLPGIELKIDMPEVDHDKVISENPALAAAFRTFDQYTGKLEKS